MIKKSRYNGLLAHIYKDPKFKDDPKLFDPTRPSRPNPYQFNNQPQIINFYPTLN